MKKEMLCLSCPVGCLLTVTGGTGGELSVSGNQCPKGEEYAREEIRSPSRIVTTTCSIKDGVVPRLPVRTDKPLPLEHIDALLQELHALEIEAPVHRGDRIISNFKATHINVTASLSVESRRTHS